MGNRRHFAVLVLVTLAVAGTSWWRAIEAAPAAPPLVAPDSLMATGLYASGRVGPIDARNRPFSPQYPLWTDGATKRRWIQLPAGTRIDVSDVNEWEFPVGTKLWKEFAFAGRKVTRFLRRTAPGSWVVASYVWNSEGTDATLAPADGIHHVAEVAPNRLHSIPSLDQFRACHVSDRTEVLGFNALQLSTDRNPNALRPGNSPGARPPRKTDRRCQAGSDRRQSVHQGHPAGAPPRAQPARRAQAAVGNH